jgi:hypothetical protein
MTPNMHVFQNSVDSIQNKKGFLASFNLETRIKLQLTADIKPDSRKQNLLDSLLVHRNTINK